MRRGADAAATHESARRNWWGPPFDGSGGCEQVRSPWSSPGPSLAGLATCEPGSRDRPEDHSSNRSGGSTCPFGQDEMYGRGPAPTTGLSTKLRYRCPKVIPELAGDVDGLWIHSPGRCADGSSARPPDRGAGSLGAAVRRLQPSLAERPVPPDPPGQGPAQRHLARPPAPRGRHGHPDRDAPARRSSSTSSGSRGRRHRARRRPSCSCWPPR